MKIKHLLVAALAMAAMAACDKEPVQGPATDGALTETSYLSINISNAPTTRAAPTDDAIYEDGNPEAEYAVNNIRFYFFTETGDPAKVVKSDTDDYVNYFDYTPKKADITDDTNENIDKTVKAVLVINTSKDQEDKLPAKIGAIVNTTISNDSDLTLKQFRNMVGDYRNTNDGFVMSSSVFAVDGVCKDVVDLQKSNFQTSSEAALKYPVKMYVERVLAKVRTSVAPSLVGTSVGGTVIYKTGSTSDKEASNGNNDVYVKFLGWDVTTLANKSYLVKNINASWEDADVFDFWNYAPYYRSYWAINPTGLSYEYLTFNEIDTSLDGTTPVYCQENASNASDGTDPALGERTQVIVAGELVDKEGNTLALAEWQGFRYKAEDVAAAVLATLQNQGYKVELTDQALTANDIIDFKTPIDLDGKYEGLAKAYGHEVYPQLNEEHREKVTIKTQGGDVVADVNTLLFNLGSAKYWKDGLTYYYIDIQHLGKTDDPQGHYGVVRNHIYDVKITSVAGLGTPVFDPSKDTTEPEEEIIPEKPTYEDSYLAAQINILSWRVVNQNADLN